MIECILILLLIIVLIYLFWKYSELKGEIENRARDIYGTWRATELETQANEKAKSLFQAWAQQDKKGIREDAIKRSEAVIPGKVTEHLIPFPGFQICYERCDIQGDSGRPCGFAQEIQR